MATFSARLAKLEGLVIVPDERDKGMVGLFKWWCVATGNQFNLADVPCDIKLSDFLKKCSGGALPICNDDEQGHDF